MLLDAKQAAELLNVKESFVRSETRAGRLPHIVLGARYRRYEEAELRAWVEARRRGPGTTS